MLLMVADVPADRRGISVVTTAGTASVVTRVPISVPGRDVSWLNLFGRAGDDYPRSDASSRSTPMTRATRSRSASCASRWQYAITAPTAGLPAECSKHSRTGRGHRARQPHLWHGPSESEAEVVDREGRVAAAPYGGAATPGRLGPAAAAENAVRAVDLFVVQVPAPFPNVAQHVVQPPTGWLPCRRRRAP